MLLTAIIVDPASGEVDPELSASLSRGQHRELFTNPEFQASAQYPLLTRMVHFDSPLVYSHEELEGLISELEHATMLFPFEDGNIKAFFGPFHLVCVLAWVRGKIVSLEPTSVPDASVPRGD